ncbi:hypothetical protein ACM66B_006031 [Microbotryomycetes sp. NB124-2]
MQPPVLTATDCLEPAHHWLLAARARLMLRLMSFWLVVGFNGHESAWLKHCWKKLGKKPQFEQQEPRVLERVREDTKLLRFPVSQHVVDKQLKRL